MGIFIKTKNHDLEISLKWVIPLIIFVVLVIVAIMGAF
jgi:uncharacterized protein HemY